jgi:hypothetical protein
MKTMGIVVVAALAANAGGLFAAVITATLLVTKSPAIADSRSIEQRDELASS